MRDYAQRYGHLNNMSITTLSKSHPSGQWLSLYRPDKHDHFSQADGHMLELIMPHLIEALEVNRIIGQVHLTHADSGMSSARAIVRSDGTLYHCGKKFSELVLEIWPEWEGGRLPDELMAAVYPNRESILADHSIAISTSTLGNMLFLNIRKISLLHRLSQRELEVAKLYGQGQSYKEIGLALDISPATVRSFLGRIYSKLSIGNKVDLASLLSKE
jgi:DNA-binding CsgD family transcriptional regulator